MAEQATSVTVNIGAGQFSSDLAIANRLIWELEGDGDEENQVKLNLFPDDSAINVNTTTGSISFGTSRLRHTVEILTFQNADKVSLKYSNAQSVSITKFGSFLDAVTGNTSPQILKHDFNTSEIVASTKVYGVIRVVYDAPYIELIYTFPESCPITPPDLDTDTGEPVKIFTDGVVLALWPLSFGETAAATLQLSNPNSRCLFLQAEGETAPYIVEIGEIKSDTRKGKAFGYLTLIKIFPAGLNPELEVSNGAKPIITANDSNITLTIKNEYVSFTNGFSGQIRYPINTGLSAAPEDDFFDEFGRETEVVENMIALPGQEITEVRRLNSFQIGAKLSKRKVRRGEIVLTDGNGFTLPLTGIVRCSYVATYDSYAYLHVTKRGTIEELDVEGAILTVRSGFLSSVFIIPPRFEGVRKPTTAVT